MRRIDRSPRLAIRAGNARADRPPGCQSTAFAVSRWASCSASPLDCYQRTLASSLRLCAAIRVTAIRMEHALLLVAWSTPGAIGEEP